MNHFEFQPKIEGRLIKLSPLEQTQFDDLQCTAKNLETWADYPNQDVRQSGSLKSWFVMGVKEAKALAVFDQQTNIIIGTTRYYPVPDDNDGVGIGYTFLDAQFRRNGQTNAELKRLMFEHAFSFVSTIWFHVLPDNLRSQAAVRKLGVTDSGIQTLHLTDQPRDYATFSISKEDWNFR